MSNIRVILRNIFSNWVAYFVSVVIGLVLSPIVVHSLGNDLYGIWTIIVSFSGYYGLVNFGITPSISYYLSHYYARGDVEQINRVASTAQTTLTLLSLLVMLIALPLAFWGGAVFSIEPQHAEEFTWAVLIMALTFVLGFLFAVYQSFFVVLQRYDLRNAVQISTDILRALLIFLALKNGYKIITISLITCACSLATYSLYALIISRMYPQLRLRIADASRQTLGMIMNYGVFALLGEMARQILFYSSAILIGIFLNTAMVTFFAIAGNLIEYARNFLGTMTRVFFPVAAQSHSRAERESLQTLFLEGTKYSFLITILLIAGFITMGKQFIVLWMGPDYEQSYRVLFILSIGYVPYFLSYTSHQVMLGMKQVAFVAKANMMAAIVSIVVSVLLIHDFGIEGVAMGTMAALLVNSWYVIKRCMDLLGVCLRLFVGKVILGPMISVMPALFLGFFFKTNLYADSWHKFLIQMVIMTCLFIVAAGFICIDRRLRARIIRAVFPG